jgi:hypothetical protein
VSGKWLAGLSVLAGTYVFRFLVGVWEDRHLVTNVPILLMFAVAGAAWLLARISARWKIAIAGVALAAVVVWNISRSPMKRHYGYDLVARYLVAKPQFAKSVVLVCGGAIGEGALISEIAMRESRPGHFVLRATKLLAHSDWMGWNYRALFNTETDTMRYVEGIPAGIVVIDWDGRRSPHGRLLFDGLRGHPEKWELLAEYPSGLFVFRLIGHEGRAAENIPMPVPSTRLN